MSHATFDPESHPRNSASGRFTPASHSAPESSLGSPITVQGAIDELTGGRETLERETRSGVFYVTELEDAQAAIWNRAAGQEVTSYDVRQHLGSTRVEVTADNVERVLGVAFHRATSGRYTIHDGRLHVAPVTDDELAAADRHASALGPQAELDEEHARTYAEHALQNRPRHLPLHIFPRLAEFATSPFTEGGGAAPSKVDALHAELRRLGEGQGSPSPITRRRRDMLGSYAMHA